VDLLRDVYLGSTGYRLQTYDTNRTGDYGKLILGYRFMAPDSNILFEGEDFGCSPMHAIDSDESLRDLLGFLTLRPGDTDENYFESYSPTQMAFAEGDAGDLQGFGADSFDDYENPEETEHYYRFVNVEVLP